MQPNPSKKKQSFIGRLAQNVSSRFSSARATIDNSRSAFLRSRSTSSPNLHEFQEQQSRTSLGPTRGSLLSKPLEKISPEDVPKPVASETGAHSSNEMPLRTQFSDLGERNDVLKPAPFETGVPELSSSVDSSQIVPNPQEAGFSSEGEMPRDLLLSNEMARASETQTMGYRAFRQQRKSLKALERTESQSLERKESIRHTQEVSNPAAERDDSLVTEDSLRSCLSAPAGCAQETRDSNRVSSASSRTSTASGRKRILRKKQRKPVNPLPLSTCFSSSDDDKPSQVRGKPELEISSTIANRRAQEEALTESSQHYAQVSSNDGRVLEEANDDATANSDPASPMASPKKRISRKAKAKGNATTPSRKQRKSGTDNKEDSAPEPLDAPSHLDSATNLTLDSSVTQAESIDLDDIFSPVQDSAYSSTYGDTPSSPSQQEVSPVAVKKVGGATQALATFYSSPENSDSEKLQVEASPEPSNSNLQVPQQQYAAQVATNGNDVFAPTPRVSLALSEGTGRKMRLGSMFESDEENASDSDDRPTRNHSVASAPVPGRRYRRRSSERMVDSRKSEYWNGGGGAAVSREHAKELWKKASAGVGVRASSAPSRPSIQGSTRHLHWRESRINSLTQSNVFYKALDAIVLGDRAMHPERATSGYRLLQRVRMTVEDGDFDDRLGREIVEQSFFDSIPRSRVIIKTIEQVLRADLLKRFLKKVSDESASVEICWHGTQEKYVDAILETGLNPKCCATGAYGVGAYVGTHAGVAHQYADPNEDQWRHMCVMLCVVGTSVVKGKEGEQSKATATDRLVNPTQYCFVEEDRLYCTHLITYKVPPQDRRRTGGGFEDPFQRKLATAVSKAARDRNKDGTR